MPLCVSCFQVLCPRCDIGAVPQKSRCKKAKDAAQSGKKSPTGLDSLCDVERALSESKDSASAVSGCILMFFVVFCFFFSRENIIALL